MLKAIRNTHIAAVLVNELPQKRNSLSRHFAQMTQEYCQASVAIKNENGKLFTKAEAENVAVRILDLDSTTKQAQWKAATFCAAGIASSQYNSILSPLHGKERAGVLSLYESVMMAVFIGGHSDRIASFDGDSLFMQYYTLHQSKPNRDVFSYFLTNAQYKRSVDRLAKAIKGQSNLVERGMILGMCQLLVRHMLIPLVHKIARLDFDDDEVDDACVESLNHVELCRQKAPIVPFHRFRKRLPKIASPATLTNSQLGTDISILKVRSTSDQ